MEDKRMFLYPVQHINTSTYVHNLYTPPNVNFFLIFSFFSTRRRLMATEGAVAGATDQYVRPRLCATVAAAAAAAIEPI